MRSTPAFNEFDPDVIPWQRKAIRLVKRDFKYELGTLELLLSGSVGSAKSLLAAHLGIFHCLQFPGARLLLGRKALPDLKDTIFAKIVEHLEGALKEGVDYRVNHQRAWIGFRNGSQILSRSWIDNKFKKFRSLELSAVIIEELTENDLKYKQAYEEIKMRVGRLPSVPENWIISCTNPDSPAHWAYEYFMLAKKETRKVIYSITTDNPFLPASYIDQLKDDMDPKLAQRMIYGKWVEITKEVIYYEYDSQENRRNETYEIDRRHPIYVSFDFNIAIGKPLSCVLIQYIANTFHIFNEVVVHGMRTLDACEEMTNRGLLDPKLKYILCGDATGKHRDTRNKHSDWDIIKSYFANHVPSLSSSMMVPQSNPKIRDRHIKVNAYCQNGWGVRRLFTYKDAKMADKGLRLSKLKAGSAYQEDDSDEFQHITTAIGYCICSVITQRDRKKQGTRQL